MRSLFVKIFLSFLLIILLVSTVAIVLTYLRDQQFPPLSHRDFARAAIAKYGDDAIHAYERGGPRELESYIRYLHDKSGMTIFLFDAQARPLNGRMMRHRLEQLAQRALESGEVVFPLRGSRNGLAATVRSESGRVYVVALALPEPPLPRQAFKALTHGVFGAQLLVLLVISAVICYLLARSLSTPISRLRQATQKFAAGDLGTRIGNRVKGHHEIAGLAADFDDMATKIEGLIAAQKRLLRDISHELRSPLTRLNIALELARKQHGCTDDSGALARIGQEAGRMNEMIGQLLNLTRLETGAETIDFETVDLSRLLRDLVRDAGFEAQARGCRVLLEAEESQPCNGSPELLRQALENIIRNAVNYTADNSQVEVRLRKIATGLELQVDDQGPGVPAEALEKLFDPFYRVAVARDRASGGSGIGLAIAQRSILLHGGRISAENRPEGGLRIIVILPLKSAN